MNQPIDMEEVIKKMELWEGDGSAPATEPVFYPTRHASVFKLYHPHELPPCKEESCIPKEPASDQSKYRDYSVSFKLDLTNRKDPFFRLVPDAGSSWTAFSKDVFEVLKLRPVIENGILTHVIHNKLDAKIAEDWQLYSWRTQPFFTSRAAPIGSSIEGNVFLDELSWFNLRTGEKIVTGWSWSFYLSKDEKKREKQQEMLKVLSTMT